MQVMQFMRNSNIVRKLTKAVQFIRKFFDAVLFSVKVIFKNYLWGRSTIGVIVVTSFQWKS